MKIASYLEHDYKRLARRTANIPRIIGAALTDAGFRAVLLYRFSRALRTRKFRLIAAVIDRITFHWCHCTISSSAEIGSGFVIRHAGTIVIGSRTTIGRNCEIRQGVTFGGNTGKIRDGRSQPCVGNNVLVGAGAQILGPVRVGDNVMIGANSVVITDVPSESVAVGIPARIVRRLGESVSLLDQEGSLPDALRNILARLDKLETEARERSSRSSPSI